jgi:hypothetical protein
MTKMRPLGHKEFRYLVPLFGYGLVSVIATWPLVFHLRGWVPGLGDWGQNMWALWWTRQALLTLAQSPFFTHYLFYPEGVTLLFHPLDLSDGLLAIPVYGLLGGDVSYNFIVLLSFILGGWGTYLLALYLTGRRTAGFIAGLIFSLSPYHFQRLDLGHLNLATIQWLPFYILFLLKFVRQGSLRSAALAVFFLVFNALNSWYYVVYCGLFSLVVLFWPGRKPQLEGLAWPPPFAFHSFLTRSGKIGLVLGLGILVLSPLLLPMLQLLGLTTLIGAHNPLRHSVDLLSFWVPGPPSTWAGLFEDVWISYAAQNREPGASAYLGYTVALLSLLSLGDKKWRWPAVWWWLVALAFTLLALGPRLQIDGQIFEQALPYQWLADFIPLFSITGIPGRFVVMTSLALAILAAYGLVVLAGWLYGRPAWLFFAIGLLIGLEYLAAPLRLTRTDLPDFYQTLAADRETYAILDIKWDANFLMHAQTVHGKPLIGGWLARLPEQQAAYLAEDSLDKAFLHLLLGPERGASPEPAAIQPAVQTALADHNIRYIIDHNRTAGPWLEQFVGWPVVYAGADMVVYGNPSPD